MFKKYSVIDIYEHYKEFGFFGNGINGNLEYKEILLGDKKAFSIDTPPPTVSGTLHMGHVYSYTHMDFVARYNSFCGKGVFYPIGYDDNGLPTEQLFSRNLSDFFDVVFFNKENLLKAKETSKFIKNIGAFFFSDLKKDKGKYFLEPSSNKNFGSIIAREPEDILNFAVEEIFIEKIKFQLAAFFLNIGFIKRIIALADVYSKEILGEQNYLRKFFANWSDFFVKNDEGKFIDQMLSDFLYAFEREFFRENSGFIGVIEVFERSIDDVEGIRKSDELNVLREECKKFRKIYESSLDSENNNALNLPKGDLNGRNYIEKDFLFFVERFFYEFLGFFDNLNDCFLDETCKRYREILANPDSIEIAKIFLNEEKADLLFIEKNKEILNLMHSMFSGLTKGQDKRKIFLECAEDFYRILFKNSLGVDEKKQKLDFIAKFFDYFDFPSKKIMQIFNTSYLAEITDDLDAFYDAKNNIISCFLLSITDVFKSGLPSFFIDSKIFFDGVKKAAKKIDMSFSCKVFFDFFMLIFRHLFFFFGAKDILVQNSYLTQQKLYEECINLIELVKAFYLDVAYCFCSIFISKEFAQAICLDDKAKLDEKVEKQIKENKKNKIKETKSAIEKKMQQNLVFGSIKDLISSNKDSAFAIAFMLYILKKDNLFKEKGFWQPSLSAPFVKVVNEQKYKDNFVKYCISEDNIKDFLFSNCFDVLKNLMHLDKSDIANNFCVFQIDAKNKIEIIDNIISSDEQNCLSDTAMEIFAKSKSSILNQYHLRFKDFWLSLGMGFDFRLQYSTSDKDSVAIAHKSFCDLYKKGFIYESKNGLKPVYFDSKFGVAVSQSEIIEIDSDSYFCTYEFTGYKSGKKYLIATTRPEMLPACVAVMFNPNDERYSNIVEEEFLLTHFLKVKVPIIADQEVKIDKGTGLVMLCTYGDMKDVEWMRKYSKNYNLEFCNLIDENGALQGEKLLHKLKDKTDEEEIDFALDFFDGADVKNTIFRAQEILLKTFGCKREDSFYELDKNMLLEALDNIKLEDPQPWSVDKSYSLDGLSHFQDPNEEYRQHATLLRASIRSENIFLLEAISVFCSMFLNIYFCENGSKPQAHYTSVERTSVDRNYSTHEFVISEEDGKNFSIQKNGICIENKILTKHEFVSKIKFSSSEGAINNWHSIKAIKKMTKEEILALCDIKIQELKNNFENAMSADKLPDDISKEPSDELCNIIDDFKKNDFFLKENQNGIEANEDEVNKKIYSLDAFFTKMHLSYTEEIKNPCNDIFCLLKIFYRPYLSCVFQIKFNFSMYSEEEKSIKSNVEQLLEKAINFFKTFASGFVGQKKISHAVKCSERSGCPIELIPVRQYYVKASENGFHDKVKNTSESIKWNPNAQKSVMDNWLKEEKLDWCISRDRAYGTKIPIIKIVFFSKKKSKAICLSCIVEQKFEIKSLKEAFEKTKIIKNFDVLNCFDPNLSLSPSEECKNTDESFKEKSLGKIDDFPHCIFPKKYSFKGRVRTLKDCVFELSGIDGLNYVQIEIHNENDFEGRRNLIAEVLDSTNYEKVNNGEKLELFADDIVFIYEEKKVLDTWFTSSLSPQVAIGALTENDINFRSNKILDEFSNEEKAKIFRQNFPFSLRTQAHEIIRTWAYYTIIKSLYHNNSKPWENTMISGWCLAEDNQKMSKSKGNVISPLKLIEEHGADVVRYWSSTGRLGADTKYDSNVIHDGIRLNKKIFNASKFVSNFDYLSVDNAEFVTEFMDKFMLCKLSRLLGIFCKNFDRFEYNLSILCLKDSFYDFCDNYIEIAKFRAYGNAGEEKQKSAICTLRISLKVYLSLFAIFMPIISNYCYIGLFRNNENVFDIKKDCFSKILVDCNTVYNFGAQIERIISCVRAIKSKQSVSIKKGVDTINVSGISLKDQEMKEFWNDAKYDLCAVCNCNDIILKEDMGNKDLSLFASIEDIKVSMTELS